MIPWQQQAELERLGGWRRSEYAEEIGHRHEPPNYLQDHNAVRALVQKLDAAQKEVFAGWLYAGKDCLFQDFCNNQTIADVLLNKSAAQWAEALLRTLNLWKE